MHLCLFEDAAVRHLAPLTLTRHTADLRLGMFTLAEMQQWAFRADGVTFHARPHVAGVTGQEHPQALVNEFPPSTGILMVNARFVPGPGDLLERILAATQEPQSLAFRQGDDVIAAWMSEPQLGMMDHDSVPHDAFADLREERVDGARMIGRVWELLDDVGDQITRDFESVGRRGRDGATVHNGASVIGDAVLLAHNSTVMPGAVINALDGPVYIGEGATVEEHAVVRGPCYVGPKAQIKAAARVDQSAVGYHSKVGGEVHASVFHSLAGKPHDGYVGNSYIGRWCNLGADTNTSNLKNDYGPVTMFDAVEGDFVRTDRQFLGLVMGDHSKCSINSMFNTGTVVGVFCNLYGADFPPRHIPSFSWGGASGIVEYRLEKALRVAEAVMARRDTALTDADRKTLAYVFEQSSLARADS